MEGRPSSLMAGAAHLERRPNLEAGAWRLPVLLSFERPPGESPRWHPRRTLKTAFAWPNNGKITVEQTAIASAIAGHQRSPSR
jgi:hypothetical protein